MPFWPCRRLWRSQQLSLQLPLQGDPAVVMTSMGWEMRCSHGYPKWISSHTPVRRRSNTKMWENFRFIFLIFGEFSEFIEHGIFPCRWLTKFSNSWTRLGFSECLRNKLVFHIFPSKNCRFYLTGLWLYSQPLFQEERIVPDAEQEQWAATRALKVSAMFRHIAQEALNCRRWLPSDFHFNKQDVSISTFSLFEWHILWNGFQI